MRYRLSALSIRSSVVYILYTLPCISFIAIKHDDRVTIVANNDNDTLRKVSNTLIILTISLRSASHYSRIIATINFYK